MTAVPLDATVLPQPNNDRGSVVGRPVLSVVVVIDEAGLPAELLAQYREQLDNQPRSYEFILVHNTSREASADLGDILARDWPQLRAIGQRPWQGEDNAFKIGIGAAKGDYILGLPGWPETDPSGLSGLMDELGNSDMIIARRSEAQRSLWQRLRMGTFHRLISVLFGHRFRDVFSRVRFGRADMFREVAEYGVRQHFLPLLAVANGYEVREVTLKEPRIGLEPNAYKFKPLAHVSALLDLFSLYVVLKFLQRPFRFFGSIGLLLGGIGIAITAWLIFARLVLAEPLADRPALVFGVLLIVLGVQIMALGLIGEIVIFSSSRRAKTYTVERVIDGGEAVQRPSPGDLGSKAMEEQK